MFVRICKAKVRFLLYFHNLFLGLNLRTFECPLPWEKVVAETFEVTHRSARPVAEK